MICVSIPLRTARGLNNREHHMARHRRVKKERQAVAWALAGKTKPSLPVVVTLTRLAPSRGLDEGDNLEGSLKAVRDQIAEWLGVDDRDQRVKWEYAQRRAPWGVQIEVRTA